MTLTEYLESVSLEAVSAVDDETGDSVLEIRIPDHDPITCSTEHDITTANGVMDVAARNLLSADDLWTLLCLAV